MISEIGTAVKVVKKVVDTAIKVEQVADKIGVGITEGKQLAQTLEKGAKLVSQKMEAKQEVKKLPRQMEKSHNLSGLPKEFSFAGNKEKSSLSGGSTLQESIEGKSQKSIEVKGKQEIANQAAREYNAKTHPFERAVAKGIDGVKQSDNGGVIFAETDKIYTKEDGTRCVTKITATGNRQKDFEAANSAVELKEVPEDYVWHHVDDYDVESGTITLELVEDEAHNAAKPHSGGCAQYDAVNGPSYNPARKGVL